VPVCSKVSKPASRLMKENSRFVDEDRASSIRLPALDEGLMSASCSSEAFEAHCYSQRNCECSLG